jgi:hypothetical protein
MPKNRLRKSQRELVRAQERIDDALCEVGVGDYGAAEDRLWEAACDLTKAAEAMGEHAEAWMASAAQTHAEAVSR